MIAFRDLMLLISLLICHTYSRVRTESRTVLFGEIIQNYTVLEGDTITMVCNASSAGSVDIMTKRHIVQAGRLNGSSDEFEFGCDEAFCSLTINRVEKKHADIYHCALPPQSLRLHVMYSPSDLYPLCSSNSNHHTFFLDSLQERMNFTCMSAEGYPPINITLYLKYGDEERLIQTNHTTRRNHSYVSLSYSPYLDASFDDTTLICRVSQQLSGYPNFQKSRSCGPLKLPTYSVSIQQYNNINNLNTRGLITLKCTSNVSGVELEWTDLPLDDWQYNITKTDESLELNIFYLNSDTGKSLFGCSGYYGMLNISKFARIDLSSFYLEEQKLFLKLPLVLTGVAFFTLVISSIVMVAGIKVHQFRKKRNKFRLTADSPSSISFPVDNFLCCQGSEDTNFNNIHIDESSNDNNENMEMTDNPIYGSYGNQSNTTPKIDMDSGSSYSGMEMTENVIYESFHQKTPELKNCRDDVVYLPVSI